MKTEFILIILMNSNEIKSKSLGNKNIIDLYGITKQLFESSQSKDIQSIVFANTNISDFSYIVNCSIVHSATKQFKLKFFNISENTRIGNKIREELNTKYNGNFGK